MSINQFIKPLTTRINKEEHLEIGGCDLVTLAQQYGTPLYVLDEKTIRTICREYKNAFKNYPCFQMMYASKALCSLATTCLIYQEGFGFDVVSEGELYTLKKAGVNMAHVLFNGNNKSQKELEYALSLNIGRISVDNFYELSLLNRIAQNQNKIVDIFLRITPGIECYTHEYIQTGHLDCKFGFDLTEIDKAINLITSSYSHLNLKGLHAHVGSQIFEASIFEEEIDILVKEIARIKKNFNLNLTEINIGGGLGVKYIETDMPLEINDVAKVIIKTLQKTTQKYNVSLSKVILEPGRSIISTAGVTLYTVGSSKQVPNATKYVSVDGGMADNPRPSLYQAEYLAEVVNKQNEPNKETITLAGKFCESGDILIQNISLPILEPNDIICVYNTGAYNYSMASHYNKALSPAMVLVDEGKSELIVKRDTLEDLISHEIIPSRLISDK